MKNFIKNVHNKKLKKLKKKFKNILDFKIEFPLLDKGFKLVPIKCLKCSYIFNRVYRRLIIGLGKTIKCDGCGFQPKYQVKNRGSIKKCHECFGPVKKSSRKYCSSTCCCNHRKKNTIKKWRKNKLDGISLPDIIRNQLLEAAKNKCETCGFSGNNPTHGRSVLEIDHIDGNGFNHTPTNLRVLCPNCHSMTSNHGSLNLGSGRKALKENLDIKKTMSNSCNYKPLDSTISKFYSGGYIGTKLPISIKKYLIRLNKEECSVCFFKGLNKKSGITILQIDHIDGDKFNNTPNNLKILCPNCHSFTPTFRGLNNKKINPTPQP